MKIMMIMMMTHKEAMVRHRRCMYLGHDPSVATLCMSVGRSVPTLGIINWEEHNRPPLLI